LKKISKHTLETANKALEQKGLSDFLKVIALQEKTATLFDSLYGEYKVDLKSFSESTQVALHKSRKHYAKMDAKRAKLIGKSVNGLEIVDLFYGPDKGYKNRSFYVSVKCKCGHVSTTTYTHLTKYRKEFQCQSCAQTQHGARGKDEDGKLKKRTATYNHWVKIKDTLPDEFKDFKNFKAAVGDKPFKIADLVFVEGRPKWVNLQITSNYELNLMATALRQAFRYSTLYKECLEKAKVETEDGTRYRCAACDALVKRAEVQVDHITPVAPVDGSPLNKDTLIDRVWTDKIQVLDKKCHNKKSSQENAERRKNKKDKK